MSDDLKAWLREAHDRGDGDLAMVHCLSAADRIEQLERERDEAFNAAWRNGIAQEAAEAALAAMTAERERLGREVNMARYGRPDFAWSIHKEAMAALEARLAKAVEALRLYACACEGGFCHANGNFCGGDARNALNEIEGK